MDDARRIVDALNAMWNSKDAQRMEALYAADATHEDTTSGIKRSGVPEIRELFRSTWQAIPDVRTEVNRVIAECDWVVWEWTMSATHTGDFPNLAATGRQFYIRGVSIIRVADGKVLSQCDYYDQASFLRQVGALPESK